MARQLLTSQAATVGGYQPVYAAAHADGHMFYADEGDELRIKNGNAAVCNVTIDLPRSILGVAVADHVVAVPAGEERRIKLTDELLRMARRPEGGTDPGMVWVNYSVQATVTLALESR